MPDEELIDEWLDRWEGERHGGASLLLFAIRLGRFRGADPAAVAEFVRRAKALLAADAGLKNGQALPPDICLRRSAW